MESSLKVFSIFGIGFDTLSSLNEIDFVFIEVDDLISSYHEGSQGSLFTITDYDYSVILNYRLLSRGHGRQGRKNFLLLWLVFHL